MGAAVSHDSWMLVERGADQADEARVPSGRDSIDEREVKRGAASRGAGRDQGARGTEVRDGESIGSALLDGLACTKIPE